jgi:hypothetical protein
MAHRTRLIPAYPTRIESPAHLRRPQGTVIVALMTLIALVPLGAVFGFVIAVKFGQDRVLLALVGALVGVLLSWWKRKS